MGPPALALPSPRSSHRADWRQHEPGCGQTGGKDPTGLWARQLFLHGCERLRQFLLQRQQQPPVWPGARGLSISFLLDGLLVSAVRSHRCSISGLLTQEADAPPGLEQEFLPSQASSLAPGSQEYCASEDIFSNFLSKVFLPSFKEIFHPLKNVRKK